MASDFDHTLLRFPHPSFNARTADAIRGVRARGVRFAVISGRSTQSLLTVLGRQDIDLDGLYAIGNNGAEVLQAWDRQVLASHRLRADLTATILAELDHFRVSPRVAEGRYVYAQNVTDDMVEFETAVNGATLLPVGDWSASGLSPHKIQITGERAELERLMVTLQGEFGAHAEPVFSADVLIEITAKGVNKGRALLDLCQVTGVEPHRTLTFGDNENDLPLLREAGMGVAVGNAVDELKAAADRVTAACDEDGVALVLEDVFALS